MAEGRVWAAELGLGRSSVLGADACDSSQPPPRRILLETTTKLFGHHKTVWPKLFFLVHSATPPSIAKSIRDGGGAKSSRQLFPARVFSPCVPTPHSLQAQHLH